MNYRTATAADAQTLATLRWQFHIETHPAPWTDSDRTDFIHECASWFATELASGSTVVWVADNAGMIISQICIRIVRKIPTPRKFENYIGYITNVYTLPDYRNQGIGTQLMEYVKQWAHEQKFDVLFVWPSDRSRPFYQRAGFKLENDIHEFGCEE